MMRKMSRRRRHGMMVTPQRARERLSSLEQLGERRIVRQAVGRDAELGVGAREDLDAADVAADRDDAAALRAAALPEREEALVVRALAIEEAAGLVGRAGRAGG